MRKTALSALWVAFLFACTTIPRALAVDAPRLDKKDGRYALLVEGRPFLILGGQIHNSSAWPSELPEVWQSLAALDANTVEAPAYWEQIEPEEGHFDFSNLDQLVEGARAHHLHMVLLWFGTWKNGNMQYVPVWVKTDPKRFPRMIRPDGQPTDVLSANSRANLDADKTAFTALMRHLKQIDGEQHTILLVQVENESGGIGSVRDFSPGSNHEFAGQVPADLLALAHKQPGTWNQVFGADADEVFQAYHQAKYMNEIAEAGKKEFNIPYYMNVWVSHPTVELPQRQVELPGILYPSGGAVQHLIWLWKGLAPSIDIIGPDLYTTDFSTYKELIQTYHRPDNPLWIPETGNSESYAKFFFYALGQGAIGFSPFGVDHPDGNIAGSQPHAGHARNFALIGPMDREIAQLEFEGKLKTSVEEPGKPEQELDFGEWQAAVAFGFPQADGRNAPGTRDARGVVLVAQLGPDEFLVTGFDASVKFHLPGKLPNIRSQILTAEQGSYVNGVWKMTRLLNGDEVDRGLRFYQQPEVVRVRMGKF
ncbi:MAG: DUF5597 domain-containing protein [Acidobacteriota bacterium]